MSLRSRFFALTYDLSIAKVERAGLRALRESLLANVAGRVLEVGGGTGANLPYYGSTVESLVVTEPEPPMLRRLERRVGEHTRPVTVLRAPAEDLPFEDDSFDAAVSTLVLCGAATSRAPCASSGACFVPAAGSSSSSTCALTSPDLPGCRTG